MSHHRQHILTQDFSLAPGDPEKLASLRDRLVQARYTEESIGELLGAGRSLPLRHRYRSLPLYLHRTRLGSSPETLVRLFHLGCSVPVAAAEEALAPLSLADCVNTGLVAVEGQEVHAAVELIPYEGLVLAADWSTETCAGRCQVMGVAASTRTLAKLALWPRGGRLLDLGTGCGVLALLGRARGSQVTAVDCNARAINFSQFNMCLNGLSSVDWRVADFFQPLAAGTFDVVLCNPPFIISPRADALHSDNGQPADQLCRSLVRAAPGWLSAGGYFQMPFNWAQRRDEDWRDSLAGWCQGISCDALLMYSHLQDAAEYALDRLRETVEDTVQRTAEFDRWMAYYQEQRIEAIGFGVMTLRRTEERAPWFQQHQFRAGEQPENGAIRQAFARRDFFRTHPTDTLLFEARLRRADRLMRQQKHTHSDQGWALIESRLGVLGGPSPTAVPAEVVRLIESCDGKAPIGEFLTTTSSGGKDPRIAEFAATVRQLVELGLLEPVLE